MLVEIPAVAVKTISARTDEEMYYRVRALANRVGVNPSTIIRLAVAGFLRRTQEDMPAFWEAMKDAS